MNIQLIRLELENFKGIKHFVLDAGGKDVKIYGDNATGKTTIADAFFWLIFNKDSQGNTKFNIKTLGVDGNDINHLRHSVYAVLNIDGSELHIKKTYYEKWTKKKGSPTESFSGHSTDYEIGKTAELMAPKKLKDYNEIIKSIVPDEEIFKLTTNPIAFNSLKMEQRKSILMSLVDEVTDEDVIASNSKLEGLKEMLADSSLEDFKALNKRDKNEINNLLKAIPHRIDEINHNMPDLGALNKEAAEAAKTNIEKEMESAKNKYDISKYETEIDALKLKKREVSNDMSAYVNNFDKEQNKEAEEIKAVISIINAKIEAAAQSEANINQLIGQQEKEKTDMSAKYKMLKVDIQKLNEEQKTFETKTVCECCGQDIPLHMQEAAISKMQERYNLEKSERLEFLNTEILNLKKKAPEISKRIKELTEQLEVIKADKGALNKELDDKTKELSSVETAEVTEALNTPKYLEFLNQHDALDSKIESLKDKVNETKTDGSKELEDLNNKLIEAKTTLEQFIIYDKATKRIEELKRESDRLAARYEEIEEREFLAEEFMRTKVELMEDAINSKFKFTKFKLYNNLINGGIEETCEATFEGVPFNSGLNNAKRINVGLDIINTLSNHYDFYAPIVIDNAESVTKPEHTESQQIKLYVSEENKELKIEV